MRGQTGYTSLQIFIDFGDILGEISGVEDAHYRVTGAIRARKPIFRITVTGKDGTDTGPRTRCMLDPPSHTSLSSFGHKLWDISGAEDADYRKTGPIRACKRIFRITVIGNDGTETGPRTWRMRGPPGHTSLLYFIDFGHILGKISGAEDAHYRVTGPMRARQRIFRIAVTGNDGTETCPRTWRMRGLPGHKSLPKFMDFGHKL
ncbi:hypothetical protein DPMN_075115 [Dreissena polymorpha]|uniref:Uncharacterized protein n=1 Tax=Dreissena polymorpha TaxID=45954 RepID=A0A9D3YHI3_DREPO|nr:hypothetical protein DPMN_075115 [Dreissena polymorpha]